MWDASHQEPAAQPALSSNGPGAGAGVPSHAGLAAASDDPPALGPTAGASGERAAEVMAHWAEPSSAPRGAGAPGPVQRMPAAQGAWDFEAPWRAVQHKPRDGEATATDHVQAAARQGTSGAGSPLPHLDQIQRAFGPGHDLSQVQAHVGGAAADASRQMGAEAYATGNHVAFRDAPSLHTAAHEAAHVVQQRRGVQLAGGVGEAGDAYERQADAAADQVVAGRSAESLLGPSTTAGAGGAVQRKGESAPPGPGQGPAQQGQGGNTDAASYGGLAFEVNTPNTWLVSNPSQYKTTVTAKLGKGEQVSLVDPGGGQPFNKVSDARYKWWKIKVTDGAHKDKEGWTMAGLLKSRETVSNTGTSHGDTKVGSGTVSINSGATLALDGVDNGDNWFMLTYKGIDADKMRWLQFISREIIGVDDKDKATPQSGTFTNSVGRSYQLTQGGTWTTSGAPKQENWNTDTGHATDPFYEAYGGAVRTADSTTMADLPGPATGFINKAFDDGASKVVSRAHFFEFLVQDEKQVKSRSSVNVEWKFLKKEDVSDGAKGVHSVGSTDAMDSLSPKPLADAFHAQFPAYKDLK